MSALDHLDAMERGLAAAGFPPMASWWRETIERFYRSGRRQLVARVGRRGGKSSTLCRLAVLEALFGDHDIPPGDLGIVAFVSVSRDEAAARLRTVEAILRALRVKFRPMRFGDGVELVDRPIGFRVFTASVAGVSGFTAILAIADECAKWRDSDTGVNPAREVLASLRPTMATQAGAKLVLSSSPFSTLDAHHDAFELGETDFQVTAHAPTWLANPTITEAQTRELEPDPITWSREYEAIPMSGSASSWFDPGAIESAIDRQRTVALAPDKGATNACGADFAFKSDASAIVVSRRVEGRIVLVELDELRPSATEPLKPSAVIEHFARMVGRHGVEGVWADGWYAESIREHLDEHRLTLFPAPGGSSGKVEVYTAARAALHEGRVSLPNANRLVSQLREVVAKPTASGTISISSPRRPGGHGDLVSAWVLSLWAAERHCGDYMPIRAPSRVASRRFMAPDVPTRAPLLVGKESSIPAFLEERQRRIKSVLDDSKPPPRISRRGQGSRRFHT